MSRRIAAASVLAAPGLVASALWAGGIVGPDVVLIAWAPIWLTFAVVVFTVAFVVLLGG